MCHSTAEAYVFERLRTINTPITHFMDVGAGPPHEDWRRAFPPVERYKGVDNLPGPLVTDQYDFEQTPPDGEPFNLIICTEVLEHTRRPWRFMWNLAQHLSVGGDLILTVRGYDEGGCAPVHGKHEYGDFWRPSLEAMEVLLEDVGLFPVDIRMDTDPYWRGTLLHARNT